MQCELACKDTAEQMKHSGVWDVGNSGKWWLRRSDRAPPGGGSLPARGGPRTRAWASQRSEQGRPHVAGPLVTALCPTSQHPWSALGIDCCFCQPAIKLVLLCIISFEEKNLLTVLSEDLLYATPVIPCIHNTKVYHLLRRESLGNNTLECN